ncbi:MAG TPA: hypothetical protein VJT67_15475 [Longimicrobiaceae bacterium]|nr:hypothetical protein [Longimicrobiaceae bacterium]
MRLLKAALPAVLCVAAGACTTRWEPQYGPVPQVAAAQTGRTIRVLLRDRAAIELHDVQVVDDSIIGETSNPPQRVAVALADVTAITTPKTDRSTANTAIFVVLGVIVALVVVFFAWINDVEDKLGGK